MRLWSLHPKYLDAKGLVALWREALLAKQVLAGNTRGYRNHPQLRRFKAAASPADAINAYLAGIFQEAARRGYAFAGDKIDRHLKPVRLPLTTGQVAYERRHLQQKLNIRDPAAAARLAEENKVAVHPVFEVAGGDVETWEKRAQS